MAVSGAKGKRAPGCFGGPPVAFLLPVVYLSH